MMDSYAKVGRGGAGNYYSQQDIEEAATRLKEVPLMPLYTPHGPIVLTSLQDVEAQQEHPETQTADPDASRPEYAHAGRGGAGNFKPTATAAAAATPGDVSTSVKPATIAEAGYSGRGGAGNFRGEALERRRSEAIAREQEAEEKAYQETVREVDQGLKPPEKAYLSSEKLGEQ